ncbi:hypothetical protein HDV00_008870, partial [Rhizophlyctis rosea]
MTKTQRRPFTEAEEDALAEKYVPNYELFEDGPSSAIVALGIDKMPVLAGRKVKVLAQKCTASGAKWFEKRGLEVPESLQLKGKKGKRHVIKEMEQEEEEDDESSGPQRVEVILDLWSLNTLNLMNFLKLQLLMNALVEVHDVLSPGTPKPSGAPSATFALLRNATSNHARLSEILKALYERSRSGSYEAIEEEGKGAQMIERRVLIAGLTPVSLLLAMEMCFVGFERVVVVAEGERFDLFDELVIPVLLNTKIIDLSPSNNDNPYHSATLISKPDTIPEILFNLLIPTTRSTADLISDYGFRSTSYDAGTNVDLLCYFAADNYEGAKQSVTVRGAGKALRRRGIEYEDLEVYSAKEGLYVILTLTYAELVAKRVLKDGVVAGTGLFSEDAVHTPSLDELTTQIAHAFQYPPERLTGPPSISHDTPHHIPLIDLRKRHVTLPAAEIIAMPEQEDRGLEKQLFVAAIGAALSSLDAVGGGGDVEALLEAVKSLGVVEGWGKRKEVVLKRLEEVVGGEGRRLGKLVVESEEWRREGGMLTQMQTKLTAARDKLDSERDRYETRLDNVGTELMTAQADVETLRRENTQIATFAAERRVWERERRDLESKVDDFRTRGNAEAQTNMLLKDEINRLKLQKERVEGTLQNVEGHLSAARRRLEAEEAKVSEMDAQIAQLGNDVSRLSSELNDVKSQRGEMQVQFTNLESDVTDLTQQLSSREEELRMEVERVTKLRKK